MKYVLMGLAHLSAVIALHAQVEASYEGRSTLSLNGEWEWAAGNDRPADFDAYVEVPSPGIGGHDDYFHPTRHRLEDFDKPTYVWYRRAFTLYPDERRRHGVIRFDAVKFTAEVFVNGYPVGTHVGGYTPFEMDVSAYLNVQQENEIMVKVGDWRALPDGSPSKGINPELLNIPSIWGDVSLIFMEGPRAQDICVMPDLDAQRVKVRMNLRNFEDAPVDVELVNWVVGKVDRERDSETVLTTIQLGAGEVKEVVVEIPLHPARLWSPDDPYLYELKTKVMKGDREGDYVTTQFGFREFSQEGNRFTLNGKPVYLSGANIAFHRSFTKSWMWNEESVQRVLIDIPKEHNMIFMDIHQGPPSKLWLDLCDEHGMMVLCTWPWWGRGSALERKGTPLPVPETEMVIREFKEWLVGSFNHPSIVLWEPVNTDAGGKHYPFIEDEYVDPFTSKPTREFERLSKAEQQVVEQRLAVKSRVLFERLKAVDPTRMWGAWDILSCHPYVGYNEKDTDDYVANWTWESAKPTSFDMFKEKQLPLLNDEYGPYYGLTYRDDAVTVDSARRQTEFWRRYGMAGTLPFCYYSLNNGTFLTGSFDRPKTLKPKPFMESFKWSFAPLAVAITPVAEHFLPGQEQAFPVTIFNDTGTELGGVRLEYALTDSAGEVIWRRTAELPPVGVSETHEQDLFYNMPETPGHYKVQASVCMPDANTHSGFSVYDAFVVENVQAGEAASIGRVAVVGQLNEEIEFLEKMNVDVVKVDQGVPADADVLLLDGQWLSDPAATIYLSEAGAAIRAHLQKGGGVLITEPDIRSAVELADGIAITPKRENGGPWGLTFAHWLTMVDKDHPVFSGLTEKHFRFFNGGWRSTVCQGTDVTLTGEGVTRHALLKWDAQYRLQTFTFEDIPGDVMISHILTDARLNDGESAGKYPLQPDPVARRVFLNMLTVLSTR